MLYTEQVMDHFMNPRNMGEMDDASGVGTVGNAKCGDIMRIYIKVENDVITDVKFKTFGCGAAIATSSKATEIVKGMTLEEAIQAVDLFIDGCVMQSLKNVQIIHGKGTGTLRSGIQQHLKRHPSVSEFRLGKYGEGEDGVTVVTLK